jgi:hypothetical protein
MIDALGIHVGQYSPQGHGIAMNVREHGHPAWLSRR